MRTLFRLRAFFSFGRNGWRRHWQDIRTKTGVRQAHSVLTFQPLQCFDSGLDQAS